MRDKRTSHILGITGYLAMTANTTHIEIRQAERFRFR